eukprot:TRINITY_DN16439_c0_g1_i2.p1 TRINITY_DN16439_c0_g1~~TRINITY_DN16439_c0_g1_i2.p1  ORF type:complete len:551 (-),score=135.52 TRINITY_DN16439_c0_g1_i2:119-1771(-)
MLAYGGETYPGYGAQYEDSDAAWSTGDPWAAWGAQQWGATYDQVPYDCSGWGYAQQTQPQTWGTATTAAAAAMGVMPTTQEAALPGPKVGAELLTELRLAELKRLIDRDAQALRATTPEGVELDSNRSADCTTRAPDSNEDTPPRPADDTDGNAAAGAPVSGDGACAAVVAAVAAASEAETTGGAGVEVNRRPAPGLEMEKVEEECFLALADYEPHSRTHGEMPVRAYDEVYVCGEQHGGWIYGAKRGTYPDEGWLPARALGLSTGSSCGSEASDAEGVGLHDDAEVSSASAAAGDNRRGESARVWRSRDAAGGRKAATSDPSSAGRGQASNEHGGDASAETRNAAHRGGTSKVKEEAPQSTNVEQGEEEPWHHHGNWWSRQRHLKPAVKADAVPAAPAAPPAALEEEEQEDDAEDRRASGSRKGKGGAGAKRGGRRSAAAEPEEHRGGRDSKAAGKAGGKGSSGGKGAGAKASNGKGAGAGKADGVAGKGRGEGGKASSANGGVPERSERLAPPRGERRPRERAALSSLLDRLNKPLQVDAVPRKSEVP